MSELMIYQNFDLKKDLGKLVENIYKSKTSLAIYCQDRKLLEEIDKNLWVYSQLSFIPHSTIYDSYSNQQAILITDKINDNINKADILISIDYLPPIAVIAIYQKLLVITQNFIDEKTIEEIKKQNINIYNVNKKDDGKWSKSPVI